MKEILLSVNINFHVIARLVPSKARELSDEGNLLITNLASLAANGGVIRHKVSCYNRRLFR